MACPLLDLNEVVANRVAHQLRGNKRRKRVRQRPADEPAAEHFGCGWTPLSQELRNQLCALPAAGGRQPLTERGVLAEKPLPSEGRCAEIVRWEPSGAAPRRAARPPTSAESAMLV